MQLANFLPHNSVKGAVTPDGIPAHIPAISIARDVERLTAPTSLPHEQKNPRGAQDCPSPPNPTLKSAGRALRPPPAMCIIEISSDIFLQSWAAELYIFLCSTIAASQAGSRGEFKG